MEDGTSKPMANSGLIQLQNMDQLWGWQEVRHIFQEGPPCRAEFFGAVNILVIFH